ncbi:MAG TPA: methylenetetrahydrofolate reductase [NAD(P)H] [Solirubrobacterales bacterium]|nr:methylenetetrahydrofolate reductase [NAD(P)H] [Solirubrobacterales bacterium]
MRIDEILATNRPVFSFEFFPPRTPDGVEALFDTIATLKPLEPSFVSVTYGAGGATRDGTVELATTIKREHGLEAMAHLSCVGETAAGLVEILDRLGAGGIENVLALRGDPPRGQVHFEQPKGGLESAAELAAFISERYEFALGGACFPEVHPEAETPEADLAYLKTKVTSGASFLITQLFFDNRVYFEFVEAARATGIDVPIIPGVIPITSYAQIVRFCDLCAASIPSPLADAMEALNGDPRAEAELGIAYAARQCHELLAGGAPGIHFYTLNRAPATRAVLAALRATRPWEGAEATPASMGLN